MRHRDKQENMAHAQKKINRNCCWRRTLDLLDKYFKFSYIFVFILILLGSLERLFLAILMPFKPGLLCSTQWFWDSFISLLILIANFYFENGILTGYCWYEISFVEFVRHAFYLYSGLIVFQLIFFFPPNIWSN